MQSANPGSKDWNFNATCFAIQHSFAVVNLESGLKALVNWHLITLGTIIHQRASCNPTKRRADRTRSPALAWLAREDR